MKLFARLALLFALATLGAAGENKPRDWSSLAAKDKDAFPVVLEKLKVTKLRGLDPSPYDGTPTHEPVKFHNWRVLWVSSVRRPSVSSALIGSLRVIVDSPSEAMSACFNPHHGATLTDGKHTFDVVICFDCSRFVVYAPDGKLAWGGSFTTANSEHRVWDQIFREAQPDDRVASGFAPNTSLERTRER